MNRERLLGLLSPLIFLALWEALVATGALDARLIPAPSTVLVALVDLARSGELWGHIAVSLARIAAGFVLGAAPAVALGVVMGLSRPARVFFTPLVAAIYPVPKIALVPLVIILLGLGEASKIAMVAISVFFMVVLSTMAGVMQVERGYFNVGRNYGADRLRLVTTVALPGAMPAIFAGLKLGLGFALLVIVGTELLAAKSGIGYLIWQSYQILAIDRMFVGLLVTAILGWLIALGTDWLERRLIPWQEHDVRA